MKEQVQTNYKPSGSLPQPAKGLAWDAKLYVKFLESSLEIMTRGTKSPCDSAGSKSIGKLINNAEELAEKVYGDK